MKLKTLFALLIFSFLGINHSYSQGFTPPAEGKSVVYFTRVSGFGFAISFEFFDGKQMIGKFKGKNYMRYECDPGEHLFWASSENKEFMTAELEEGKSYIVLVHVIMGGMKARVGLAPCPVDNEDFGTAQKLVLKKAPKKISQKEIGKIMKKLNDRGFIEDNLSKYENEWKNTKNFKHLKADMFVPENEMK